MLFSKWMGLKESQLYSTITCQMDKMGHLHMWKGEVDPLRKEKYLYTVNGSESDSYLQDENDINQVVNYLTQDEQKSLKEGYPITSNSIPDEYFEKESKNEI